jgi:hypothetical protein
LATCGSEGRKILLSKQSLGRPMHGGNIELSSDVGDLAGKNSRLNSAALNDVTVAPCLRREPCMKLGVNVLCPSHPNTSRQQTVNAAGPGFFASIYSRIKVYYLARSMDTGISAASTHCADTLIGDLRECVFEIFLNGVLHGGSLFLPSRED